MKQARPARHWVLRAQFSAEEQRQFKQLALELDMTVSELATQVAQDFLVEQRGGRPYERALAEEFRKDGADVCFSGWPDLGVALPNGQRVFVEIKSAREKIRPNQSKTMAWLVEAGFKCFVLRPQGLYKFQRNHKLVEVQLGTIGLKTLDPVSDENKSHESASESDNPQN